MSAGIVISGWERVSRSLGARALAALFVALLGSAALGQNPAPATPPKTTVNADRSITFRLAYPGAKQVTVAGDATLKPLPMTQDANGVWTATTPPLEPNVYGYAFVVDGTRVSDPNNYDGHPNYITVFNDVVVPGDPPGPWELTEIPHGNVTRHIFTTHFGVNYPNNQTAYVVYTPPGYDAKRKGGYPVLYLLHGYSGGEVDWTVAGRANLMMDRMIADGKIVPMIVVMPRGYGDFDVVGRGVNPPSGHFFAKENTQLFVDMLTREIIPAVEREYNVAAGRENRAVTGASMGGMQAVLLGLTHPELFAWVGGFSSAVPKADFDTRYPGVDAAKADLRLLWIACGADDFLVANNRAFAAWAKGKGLPVTAVETHGWHSYPVWRDDLMTFAPLLFRK